MIKIRTPPGGTAKVRNSACISHVRRVDYAVARGAMRMRFMPKGPHKQSDDLLNRRRPISRPLNFGGNKGREGDVRARNFAPPR